MAKLASLCDMSTFTTLRQLADAFFLWLGREVAAKRNRQATYQNYKHYVERWIALVGGDRQLDQLRAWDLEQHKTNWHSVQAVQRLFNWAVEQELVPRNPFSKVKKPRKGSRRRVLDGREMARMLWTAPRPLRELLTFMRGTFCRPGEARAVRWEDWLRTDGAFALAEFKCKDKRHDGAEYRFLLMDARTQRLIRRLHWRACLRQRTLTPTGPVLLSRFGRPWTPNALRCAFRRLRDLIDDRGAKETLVPYTVRHTAATWATAAGVRDRALADLLGHTDVTMTSRYQHLQLHDLRAARDKASPPKKPRKLT